MRVSDLEQVLSEAQRARDEADAAARRATELETQAESARERARQDQIERRRSSAQRIVDSYERDTAAADTAIQEAQDQFNRVAVENLPGAVAAYIAWGEAAMRHYALQLRVSAAAPILDLEATPPELNAPPLFSDALDAALSEALGKRADAVRQEADAELGSLRDPGY